MPALADGTWSELQGLPEARQEFPAVLFEGKITATAVNQFERCEAQSRIAQMTRRPVK